jgi:hypothetical protein
MTPAKLHPRYKLLHDMKNVVKLSENKVLWKVVARAALKDGGETVKNNGTIHE